ncbi:MAG: FtsH protease activity modulator HflK [Steroidobacteraceae bacterium]
MAWNDPGKKSNPWQRGPEQGPPDLDEVLRRLQQRLRGLFGGAGGGSGDDGGAAGGPALSANLSLILVVVLGLWSMTGFYAVDEAERGVITRFGRYVGTSQPGWRWHLPWPIERRTIVNVSEFKSYSDTARMLTSDEALVDIELAVQYRRADAALFTFQVRDPEQTLEDVSESAIREVIGQSRLDQVLGGGRQGISARTKTLVQKTLDGYRTGIEVLSVNLQKVNVPEQVAPSQKDATKAREDKQRYEGDARAYANDVVPKARGAAARQFEDAQAYRERVVAEAEGEGSRFAQLAAEYVRAPVVTRQRLYYETMEQVLSGTNKVLLDTKGSGNNMVYLPLDRLLEQQRAVSRAGDTAGPAPAAAPAAAPAQEPVTVEMVDPRARGVR